MYNLLSPSQPPASAVAPQMNTPMSPAASLPMPTPTAPVQSFSHGGRAKRAKMIAAHVSPHELHILDHLQGHIERCPKTGRRSYSHLEELIKNPHIVAQIHHHTHKHHAKMAREGHAMGGAPSYAHGGTPDLHAMHPIHAANGMHGDSEVALIGPHTKSLFDHYAEGGTAINPYDGHPQYFSLSGLLSGAWNAIKGIGSKIGNFFTKNPKTVGKIVKHTTNAISDHLQNRGQEEGGRASSLAHSLDSAQRLTNSGGYDAGYGSEESLLTPQAINSYNPGMSDRSRNMISRYGDRAVRALSGPASRAIGAMGQGANLLGRAGNFISRQGQERGSYDNPGRGEAADPAEAYYASQMPQRGHAYGQPAYPHHQRRQHAYGQDPYMGQSAGPAADPYEASPEGYAKGGAITPYRY